LARCRFPLQPAGHPGANRCRTYSISSPRSAELRVCQSKCTSTEIGSVARSETFTLLHERVNIVWRQATSTPGVAKAASVCIATGWLDEGQGRAWVGKRSWKERRWAAAST